MLKDSCMKDVQTSFDSLLVSSPINWHQAIWSLLPPWTTTASCTCTLRVDDIQSAICRMTSSTLLAMVLGALGLVVLLSFT